MRSSSTLRHTVERYGTTFHLTAIARDIEHAFSKRRQAIEQAAGSYGYRTPKGMEKAALLTRQAKRPAQRSALFEAWKQEARALGFDLARARLQAAVSGLLGHSEPQTTAGYAKFAEAPVE